MSTPTYESKKCRSNNYSQDNLQGDNTTKSKGSSVIIPDKRTHHTESNDCRPVALTSDVMNTIVASILIEDMNSN